jgi:hypothetical protein
MATPGTAAPVGIAAAAGTVPATGVGQMPPMTPAMSSPFGGPPPTLAILFGFKPSFNMAFIGAVFFSIAFFIHTYQIFKYKTKYFGPLPQAALRKFSSLQIKGEC